MKKLLGYAASIAGLASVLLVISNWRDIADWWVLRSYEPSARVSALAERTAMNDYGKRLFFVHNPQLEDKTAFNTHCDIAEVTIVLGCYVSGQGIYIYDVQDVRLNGIHEVTAAHEMLHAAYDRLGMGEREKIDALVNAAFADVNDQRILDLVEAYRERDPTVVDNELHSILATEVESLPSDLEQYYSQYFGERSKVVALARQYEQAFTDLKNQVAQYDTQLEALQAQIEAHEASLVAQSGAISSQREYMDGLLASGQEAEYNLQVNSYNSKVRAYNAELTTYKGKVNDYNRIVAERNVVAAEQQELIEAIDSRPSTASPQ